MSIDLPPINVVYFLNALRNMLGKRPLPMSAESRAEYLDLQNPSTHNIGWASGETDGCRRTRKTPRNE
jgi:hypothetical protein